MYVRSLVFTNILMSSCIYFTFNSYKILVWNRKEGDKSSC
jgi:hypothetical protein